MHILHLTANLKRVFMVKMCLNFLDFRSPVILIIPEKLPNQKDSFQTCYMVVNSRPYGGRGLKNSSVKQLTRAIFKRKVVAPGKSRGW